ncbi:unnamed protein product [Ectocarpus sp. 12 AP-2014]
MRRFHKGTDPTVLTPTFWAPLLLLLSSNHALKVGPVVCCLVSPTSVQSERWHPLTPDRFTMPIAPQPMLCQHQNDGFGNISSRASGTIVGLFPHPLGGGAIEL